MAKTWSFITLDQVVHRLTTGFYKVGVIGILSFDLRKMRLALYLPAFSHYMRQGVSVIPIIPVCSNQTNIYVPRYSLHKHNSLLNSPVRIPITLSKVSKCVPYSVTISGLKFFFFAHILYL
jgi:hypothetical protein